MIPFTHNQEDMTNEHVPERRRAPEHHQPDPRPPGWVAVYPDYETPRGLLLVPIILFATHRGGEIRSLGHDEVIPIVRDPWNPISFIPADGSNSALLGVYSRREIEDSPSLRERLEGLAALEVRALAKGKP